MAARRTGGVEGAALRAGRAVWAGRREAIDAVRPERRARLHHAKLVVCDDWVLTGSYTCSHSGELNAENLLDIRDAELADACAAFCEQVHARYMAAAPPVGSQ